MGGEISLAFGDRCWLSLAAVNQLLPSQQMDHLGADLQIMRHLDLPIAMGQEDRACLEEGLPRLGLRSHLGWTRWLAEG